MREVGSRAWRVWAFALLGACSGGDAAPEHDAGGPTGDGSADTQDGGSLEDAGGEPGLDGGLDAGSPDSDGAVPPTPTLPAFCAALSDGPSEGQWQSTRVRYEQGRLVYAADAEQNRLADFSYAGYHHGERALPDVPVVSTLEPIAGDNTAHIQAALDAIGEREPDANGHRGTLLLAPGEYVIEGSLRLARAGVVLRGAGDGPSSEDSTLLIGRGDTPHQRTLIELGSRNGDPWSSEGGVDVTSDFVQVGALSLEVEDTRGFAIGDEVLVTHPSTQAWIDAVGGGGMVSDADWEAGSKDIRYVRRVRSIEGRTLGLDAPLFNHLDSSLAQARVAKVSERDLVAELGVESLRIDIETAGGEDEDHVWNGIGLSGAENSWVRDVTVLHFGKSAVVTSNSIRITVLDVDAHEPVAIRTGERMYNFDAERQSQLVLFSQCRATGGRHHYISNGVQTTSGIVFHRGTSGAGSASEGHRHWSQGMLFDAIEQTGGSIVLINRGDYGTSHGWGAAHSVVWNTSGEVQVQKPPTAQNYLISPSASPRTNFPFPGAQGYVEQEEGALFPPSLYEAQLCERLRE